MSLNGLFNTQFPLTLDGTTSLDVSSITVDGQDINVTNLVPYIGATQALDMGAQPVRSSHAPSAANDLINYTTLVNAISNQDTTNAVTFLNKITATAQSVVGAVTFNSTITGNSGYYTDTSGFFFARPNANYNSWSIIRISNSGVIRDLAFTDDTASQRCLLLSSTGQTMYVGLTADWATAERVPIFNASKSLVSSSVTSTELGYLSGVTSALQTQLNAKANLAGGNTFTGTNVFQALQVSSGYALNLGNGSGANQEDSHTQLTMGWNGSPLEYRHRITSEHNSFGNTTSNTNSINFYLWSDSDATGDLGTNHRLTIAGGGVGIARLNPTAMLDVNGTSLLDGNVTVNGTLALGANKATTTYVPVNAEDLTNKAFTDATYLTSANLTGYVPYTGATNNLNMGTFKVQSNASPSANNDLTTKLYVDTQNSNQDAVIATKASTSYVDTADGLRLLKAGDTATGTIYNSGGNFHPYRGGDVNRSCILFANNADGATTTNYNGGLGSWWGIGFLCTLDSTTRFIFNTRDGSSSQTGRHTVGNLTLSGQTASRVLTTDGSSDVVASAVTTTELGYVSGVTSAIQTQIDTKASTTYVDTQDALRVLKSGDTMTGVLTVNNTVNVGNRLLGTVDGSNNWWIGLRGSGSEVQRLAIALSGDPTTGEVSYISLGKPVALSANKITTTYVPADPADLCNKSYVDTKNTAQDNVIATKADTSYVNQQDALRVPYTGANQPLVMGAFKVESSYYPLLGYDLCNKSYVDARDALYLPLTGGTISSDLGVQGDFYAKWHYAADKRAGLAPEDQGSKTMGYWFGTQNNNNTGGYSDVLCLNGWSDSTAGYVNALFIAKAGKGIRQYQGTHGSATDFSTYYDCVMTDGNSTNVTISGTLLCSATITPIITSVSGASASITENIKLVSNSNHYDTNVAETYLFTGLTGYMMIGRNTTRSASVSNLMIGSASANVSEILSVKTDASGYMPMNFGASSYLMTGGVVEIRATGGSNPATNGLYVYNTNNTAGQDAIVAIRVAGSSAGDAYTTYDIADEYGWSTGVLNSDNSYRINKKWASVSNDTHTYFYNWGTVDIKGGSGGTWGASYAKQPGTLIIGRTDTNYGGQNSTTNNNVAGLLLECADTTEIQIHDSGARLASFMYYSGNVFYIGRESGWGTTSTEFRGSVTVYSNTANSNGGAYLSVSNQGSGGSYAVMSINSLGANCYWFLNSQDRPDDGGVRCATLRNDNGDMRLQAQGAVGITVTATSGAVNIGNTLTVGGANSNGIINVRNPNGSYSHFGWTNNWNYIRGEQLQIDCVSVLSAGDLSYCVYGPNATWGSYLHVGASLTAVFGFNQGKAQVISTNGNLHLDAGSYRQMYYGYYADLAGYPNEHQFYGTINSYDGFYNYGFSFCGTTTQLGNGCAEFSQNWDRCLIFANGYDVTGGYFYYNQANNYGTISDRRIKEHLQAVPTEQSIAFLKAVEPTSFCMKPSKPCMKKVKKKKKPITEPNTDEDGNEKVDEADISGVEEVEVCPEVCCCRQEGWIAQNIYEACVKSGASKSVINKWGDYEKELLLPEEERTTLIGVSDRPILSHTVNVVKALLERVEVLEKRETMWEQHARIQEATIKEQGERLTKMEAQLEKVGRLLAQMMPK